MTGPALNSSSTSFNQHENSIDQPKITILEEIFEALTLDDKTQEPHSLLLALPAELRSAIYTAALFDDDCDLSLLRTCQQIYMEASPAIYQRPISFSSQGKFISWIDRSNQSDLKRVRTITLRLTDIDMSPLFELTPSKRSARPTAWNLYQQELESLDRAMQSLPGLQDLTIAPPEKSNNSQLLKSMYLSFLSIVAARLPNLKQLTVHDEECVLEKVPCLKQLSGRVRIVFDASKAPKGSGSSSNNSPSRGKAVDLNVGDGVPIKVEKMDVDEK